MAAIVHAKDLTHKSIRTVERASIRDYVDRHKALLTGRVLDFGAGRLGTCVKPQPYRDLCTGDYEAYDKGYKWPQGQFDCVLMTQVLHLIDHPTVLLDLLSCQTRRIIITYPTLWQEVQADDLWRFTKQGMKQLLEGEGTWKILDHEPRWSVRFEDFSMAGGYGVVAENQRGPYHTGNGVSG